MNSLLSRLFRVKHLREDDLLDSPLSRCLNLFDVASIGLGVMLSSGIYTVTGVVIENVVGPAAVISYALASLCAAMSALCYAEFSSRVPKAGSAYIFSYVTVGELVAFVIGWSLLIEYCVATASIGKAWAAYVDAMFNHTVKHHAQHVFGLWQDPEADSAFNYTFDIGGVVVITVIGLIVAIGLRLGVAWTSSLVQNVLLLGNGSAIAFIVVYGLTFADFDNWRPLRQKDEGFTPYGYASILTASSMCFFAFTGFEAMCTVAEETKNPRRTIPRAVLLSIGISTLAYMGMSTSLSLMLPFDQVRGASAFADAFAHHGVYWARTVVSMGAICGMTTGAMVEMTAASRLAYAMASDGMLFRPLAYVHQRTQTPIWGVLCVWLMAVVLATVFTIHTLVEFVAIDTMMAYTIVVVCVLVLRYRPDAVHPATLLEGSPLVPDADGQNKQNPPQLPAGDDEPDVDEIGERRQLLSKLSTPRLIALILTLVVLACLVVRFTVLWSVYVVGGVIAVVLGISIAFLTAVLSRRRQYNQADIFQVPCLPWLPVVSIFLNTLLIVFLPLVTWLRFLFWLLVGLSIYVIYGYRHSHERNA